MRRDHVRVASVDELTLAPAPYVVIELAAALTGLSAKAIERKIDEGVWVEGQEFVRGPDGRRYISIEGYRRWVERGLGSKRVKRTSARNGDSRR